MDAPSVAATPKFKDVQAPATTSRQWRQLLGVAATVIIATILASLQFSAAYVWHEPYEAGDGSWLLNPIEWNVDAGLPDIIGTVNAIEVAGERVIVAGNAGLLAYSDDDGRTWTQLAYSGRDGTFGPAPAGPQGRSSRGSQSAERRDINPLTWFLPTLAAATSNDQAPARPDVQSPQQQKPVAPRTASLDDISVDMPSYTFRGVVVGARSTVPIQFANRRPTPLLVKRPELSGDTDHFAIVGLQCDLPSDELAAYGQCRVSLAFQPRAEGNFKAQLTFGAAVVPLNGTGVAKSSAPTQTPSETPAQTPPQAPDKPASVTPSPQPPAAAGIPATAPDLTRFGFCGDTFGLCALATSDSQLVLISKNSGSTWSRGSLNDLGQADRQSIVSRLQPPVGTVRDADQKSSGGPTWVVLDNNGVFQVSNGRWIPVTRTAAASLPGHEPVTSFQQYGRFVAPWYFFALIVCGFVLVSERETAVTAEAEPTGAASRSPDPATGPSESEGAPGMMSKSMPNVDGEAPSTEQRVGRQRGEPPKRDNAPSIGEQGTADRPLSPGEPDALGLGIIATGLAFFFRNQKTKPPFVLAINGRWGSGKSSLMNLLRARLADYGACPVWFNAWHHQQEDQLLAALLEAVRKQSIPSLSSWAGWSLRFRLAMRRLQQSWVQLALILGAIMLLWQVERSLKERDLSIGLATSRGIAWVTGAKPESATERAAALLAVARQQREAASTAPKAEADRLIASADALVVESLKPLPPPTGFPRLADLVGDTSVIALLATLFAAFKAASKGLRAFASNPASLLASDSGSSNPKDLEAQANFRQRFAAEFADVTSVLGPNRRMTILIDDLDRCRPEKVREVLEAVNFLCSSGQCFVVLGMARDIVEHCVGLSFRRVVDTMPWAAFDLSQTEIDRFVAKALGTAPAASETRTTLAAKRLAFANLFLDKLIQIEVTIPQPTPLQKVKLFETDEERLGRLKDEARVSSWMDRIQETARLLLPVTKAALLLIAVAVGGWQLGQVFGPMILSLLVEPSGTQQATTQTPALLEAAKALAAEAAPVTPFSGSSSGPRPEIRASVTAMPTGWLAYWPFYVVALSGLAIATVPLRRLPHQTVRDAKPFSNALGIWHRLVMTDGARNTPRTARRFQNRVRYLAMRQRALVLGLPVALVERWVRRALEIEAPKPDQLLELPDELMGTPDFDRDLAQITYWLTQGIDGNCALGTVTQSPDGPKVTAPDNAPISGNQLFSLALGQIWIPEPILVALAAIDEMAPEWIDDADAFDKALTAAAAKERSTDVRVAALAEAIARHCTHWDNWYNLTHYRRAYLRLCSELDGKSPRQPIKV